MNESSRRVLTDGLDFFDVTVLDAEQPVRIVLFSVGAGGDPQRHLPLLTDLAAAGCTVVAPHYEHLASPYPTDAEIVLRARRLVLALDAVEHSGLSVAGVGHSIGATLLLALAGGQMWTRNGHKLATPLDELIDRLVLFAPATGLRTHSMPSTHPSSRGRPRRTRSLRPLRRSFCVTR